MAWGNNNVGPVGAPIFGNQPSAAGAVPGQAGNPAPTGGPTIYNASFESVMAAVSRGELPLNTQMPSGTIYAGNANSGGSFAGPQGNPTLLQAMTQGLPQNGTNGLGVRSAPSPANEGTAAVGIGSTNAAAGAITDSGSTLVVDPRQVTNVPAYSNPIQYGGA